MDKDVAESCRRSVEDLVVAQSGELPVCPKDGQAVFDS